MQKSEIIEKTLRETNTADQTSVVARLNERIPEGDSKTCEDFKHLNVECCPTCHQFMPENEMDVVELPEGGTAWICCAVRRAAFPEPEKPEEAAREKLQQQLWHADEKPDEFPQIGIFWVRDGGLILASTALSKALFALDPLALSTHVPLASGHGHAEYWAELQKQGLASEDISFDVLPRGEVSFDLEGDQFLLRADQCILGRKEVVQEVMTAFKLPPEITSVGRHDSYRCAGCREHTSGNSKEQCGDAEEE